MKKHIILLTALMSISMTAYGQHLFFIGEESYLSTEAYSLSANSESEKDLNIAFAKDSNYAFVAVRLEISYGNQFHGKLIIYLDDGNVVSLEDQVVRDYIDWIALAVYSLPEEEIRKLKSGNINTVRYEMRGSLAGSGNFSSSNRSGINFPEIVSEFFE